MIGNVVESLYFLMFHLIILTTIMSTSSPSTHLMLAILTSSSANFEFCYIITIA
jgi:hypothetical protein